MLNRITVPYGFFRRLLQDMRKSDTRSVQTRVAICQACDGMEILISRNREMLTQRLVIMQKDSIEKMDSQIQSALAALIIDTGKRRRGQAVGMVRIKPNGIWEPVHCLRLVGAGLHDIQLFSGAGDSVGDQDNFCFANRMSRTRGALGNDVWRRLTGLHIGITGLGRNGMAMAKLIAGIGVCRLTFVDPDVMEPHNIGETPGTSQTDVGRLKVEVITDIIQRQNGFATAMENVPLSITSMEAFNAMKACDIIFSCTDHDGARLSTSIISRLYHKPHFDIASGIHGEEGDRSVGFDVRFVLPGHCLLCFGGMRDPRQAEQVMFSPHDERRVYSSRNWRNERNGSLASLAQCATATAMRMLEDFIGKRIDRSTWLRENFYANGRTSITYPLVSGRVDNLECPVCRLAGTGDIGLPYIQRIFEYGR